MQDLSLGDPQSRLHVKCLWMFVLMKLMLPCKIGC